MRHSTRAGVIAYALACACACAAVAACGGGNNEPADAAPGPADARVDAAPTSCSPATCDGCCDGTTCRAGDTTAACGAGGGACKACGASESCTAAHQCANAADPCQGIGPEGVCVSTSRVEFCATATDGGSTELMTYDCPAGEHCQDSASGASCVLTGQCLDGQAQCTSATMIQTCSGGAWVSSTCPAQCIASPIGDFCGISEATTAFTGTLKYEARGPNASPPTDWGAVQAVPGRGFLVVVARFDAGGALQEIIDSKLTDEGNATPGAFTVQVPATATANDYILFLAAGTAPDPVSGSPTIAFAIADPNLDASATPYGVPSVGANPRIWSWSLPLMGSTSGTTITIQESNFSGAARVMDVARFVFELD